MTLLNICNDRNMVSNDTWLTPKWILDKLGVFDLDPCASPEPRPFDTARTMITLPKDGFCTDWFGRVWLNPPYKTADLWIQKLAKHGNGVVLIFARTDTKVWQDVIFPKAYGVLFMRGRIRFCFPDGREGGTAGAPSALVFFGKSGIPDISGRYIKL